MEPKIEWLDAKKLLGMHTSMSVVNNQTANLWKAFRPRINEIEQIKSTDFFSLEVYPSLDYFSTFDPAAVYQKWAAVEVASWENIPDGMGKLLVPEGLYAIFRYRGSARKAAGFYQYIYGEWIPKSAYQLDNRPHFALMGAKYQGDHPESEEDLFIPIKA